MPPRLALVTGATGLLGGALTRALVQRGVPTRVLLRRPVEEARAAGLDVVLGDLRDADLTPALSGVDVVWHCAGVMPSTAAQDADHAAVNTQATLRLARAALDAGVERFVSTSSSSVYGTGDLVDVEEDAPLRPASAYATSKVEAERGLAGLTGLDVRVLRPCGVYSPGSSPFLDHCVGLAARGAFPAVTRRDTLLGLVHVEDAVEALLLAGTTQDVAGRTYNVADGTRTTVGEVLETLSSALGVAVQTRSPPGRWARAGRTLARLTGRESGPDLSAQLAEHRHFRVDRARTELGYAPRHTLTDAIRVTVASMTGRGLLPCRS